MKRYKLFVLLFIPLISSCFDDKGNYDYHEVAEITIEGLPELLEVVGGAEHIVAAPTVKSSLEGIITEDNPNFTFTYKMELKSGGTIVNGAYWGVTLNKNGRKDVDTLATFAANTYLCMFIVTDIRTGRETAKLFDIKVTSPTYEGWMVLCNEGAQNRVRLDMISVLSKRPYARLGPQPFRQSGRCHLPDFRKRFLSIGPGNIQNRRILEYKSR